MNVLFVLDTCSYAMNYIKWVQPKMRDSLQYIIANYAKMAVNKYWIYLYLAI